MKDREPTVADLCERATMNQVAADCINPWTFYGLSAGSFGLAFLSGMWWLAPLGLIVAAFDAWSHTKASIRKESDIRANPGAWMKYSGVPMQELQNEKIRQLLGTPLSAIDAQRLAKKPIAALLAESVTTNLPPLRDLPRDIAAYDGHVAIVSKTRSGKTTALIGAIEHSLALGHAVILIDGKGDDRLRAIQGIEYLHCNRPERVAAVFVKLEAVIDELYRRQDGAQGQSISVYVDEFNLVRDTAADDDSGDVKGKAKADLFSQLTKRILLQGAAAKIYLRAASHTSRVQDWGWNTGVLDSLSFLALGRMGAYESLDDLIRFQIPPGKQSVQMQETLNYCRSLEFEEPLALTTLHPIGFYRVPKVEPLVDFGTVAYPQGETAQPFGTKLLEFGKQVRQQIRTAVGAIDDNEEMVAKYIELLPECETYSVVLERMGTLLQKRGLINERKVNHLKGWLNRNNLPHPGQSEPLPEEVDPLPPLRRKEP